MRGTGIKTSVAPAGERVPRSEFLNVSIHAVTPEYFDTLGLRILSGHAHTAADLKPADSTAAGPAPVIVNQTFVRRFVPEGSPLGKKFGQGIEVAAKPDFVIVGVVNDAKYRSLREPMQPTLYTPLEWRGRFSAPVVLHVRTGLLTSSLIRSVRELLRALDSRLPINEVTTLQEDIEASLWSEKVLARLATGFGLLAALIVATGLYGLLSFVITRRTREIGIRVALGARSGNILGLILRQTLWLVGGGIAIGLIVSFFAARAMQALLFEVSTSDPSVFGGAAFLMLVVAGAAAMLPAFRVLGFEPAAALRCDG
jgi:hypothetical protein